MPSSDDRLNRPGAPPLKDLAGVLVAGMVLFLPGLGAHGLSATEGHRVIPGWEMLERNEYWLPTLFGQVYLRKPPGMPWAVALLSSVFGETEFAARLVSVVATLVLALAVAAFAGRWFGRRYGLGAGLAAILTPLLWDPARTAEIEALNNAAAAVGVLVLLDAMAFRVRKPRGAARTSMGQGLLAGIALAVAGLAKGPAAAPALVGAVASCVIVTRSARPLRSASLWVGLAVAGALLGFVAWRIRGAVHASGQDPVLQGVSDFLWTGRRLDVTSVGEVAVMPVLALLSAFPACLVMLFPWGKDAVEEAGRSEEGVMALRMARVVTLAAVFGVLLLAIGGVRNPRYGQPCVAFAPVLVGYALRGWRVDFYIVRRRIASVLMLGRPGVLGAVLLVAAIIVMHDPFGIRRNTSGRAAGREIGAAAVQRGEMWADHMVEARPEVLWYAKQEAARAGVALAPKWKPGLAVRAGLVEGGYLLLRQDAESDEAEAYRRAGVLDRLRPATFGRVHKFGYVLYEVDSE